MIILIFFGVILHLTKPNCLFINIVLHENNNGNLAVSNQYARYLKVAFYVESLAGI